MSAEQRHVRDDSDELLNALDEMKRMELEKREKEISTDEFHKLADEIEDQSRKIFSIADDQRRTGDRAPRTGASVSDVQPSREPTAAD